MRLVPVGRLILALASGKVAEVVRVGQGKPLSRVNPCSGLLRLGEGQKKKELWRGTLEVRGDGGVQVDEEGSKWGSPACNASNESLRSLLPYACSLRKSKRANGGGNESRRYLLASATSFKSSEKRLTRDGLSTQEGPAGQQVDPPRRGRHRQGRAVRRERGPREVPVLPDGQPQPEPIAGFQIPEVEEAPVQR